MIRSVSLSLTATVLALALCSCGSAPAAAPASVPPKTIPSGQVPAEPPAPPVSSDILRSDLGSYKGPADAAALLKSANDNLARRQLKPENLSRSDQILYGNLLLANQNFEPAKALYERLLNRDDKDRDALFALAQLSSTQPEKQRVYLNRLLTAYPGDAQVKVLQGQIELDAGNKPAARQAFEASLKTSDNADALIGLAQLAQNGKKWDEALGLLNRAEKADPANDLVYAERAKVFASKELFYDAEKDINKALSLQPENPWHFLDRARLYWLHMYRPAEALADLEKVVAKDPENFFAHVYRGEIFESQDKAKEAWTEYQKVLAQHPDYRYAYPPSTILAFQFKQFDRALTLAQEAWKDYPGEYAFPIIAVLSAQKLGQPQVAKAILDKAQVKFATVPAVAEMFRFLAAPKNDYFLNDLLAKEKDKTTICRLRYYEGCALALSSSPASARAALQEASGFTILGVPEIRMAKDWLEGLQ